jgi:hypothetical protein
VRLALVLIVIFSSRYWYLVKPAWPAVQAEAQDWQLKVMTFNINYRNNRTDEIAALIRSQDADMVALQELTNQTAARLQTELAADYPYFLLGTGEKNVQGLFSRYPLIRQPDLPSRFTRHFQQVVVQTPAGPVTIINVHPRVAVKQKLWEFQRDTVIAIARRVTAVTGMLAERGWDRRFITMVAAMLLGSVVIFAFGLANLSRFLPGEHLLAAGLLPFIPGDIVKSSLAALAFPTAWRWVRRHQGSAE